MLTGNNSILRKVLDAKNNTDIVQSREELQVAINGISIDYHTKNNSEKTFRDYIFNEEEGKGIKTLQNELGGVNLNFDEENNQITYKSIVFNVAKNGVITYAGGSSNIVENIEPGLYNDDTGELIKSWDEIAIIGESNYEEYDEKYEIYVNNGIITGSILDGNIEHMKLVLSNSVTGIEDYAFSRYTNLTSIIIPNSVTNIGEGAFAHCSSLTSVILPSSITRIKNYTFSYCEALTSITIPSGVTRIGYAAFGNCSNLTSVTIPNSVISIGEGAFEFCSSLTGIIIPNSVTSIGYAAFWGCSSLISIVIPSSVTSIDDTVFSYCSNLTSITIPNGVTSLGDYVFWGCDNLTSITIDKPHGTISGAKWNAPSSCEVIWNDGITE